MDFIKTKLQCNKILSNAKVLDYKNNTNILCCFVLNKTINELLMVDKITDEQHNKIISLAKKRAKGVPLQYLVKYVDFYYNKIYVNKNVLIPRNAPEHLCDIVCNEITDGCSVLDLCSGSGCIGLAIKRGKPNCSVTLSDISKKAIYVAKKNAKLNNLNVKFINSNLFENINKKFDVIVSNPPYIKTEDIKNLSIEVKHEPVLALDGDKNGLKFYKEIATIAPKYLNKNGVIYFECGAKQPQVVAKYLKKNFDCIRIISDYYGKQRFVVGVLKD